MDCVPIRTFSIYTVHAHHQLRNVERPFNFFLQPQVYLGSICHVPCGSLLREILSSQHSSLLPPVREQLPHFLTESQFALRHRHFTCNQVRMPACQRERMQTQSSCKRSKTQYAANSMPLPAVIHCLPRPNPLAHGANTAHLGKLEDECPQGLHSMWFETIPMSFETISTRSDADQRHILSQPASLHRYLFSQSMACSLLNAAAS